MELLTILLSALLGVLAPVGLVIDNVAEAAIRDQLDSVEELAVRIDNAPSYQLAQGRIDRVRIAGRGLFPYEGVRIAALEVETDPIALNPRSLRAGQPELEQPLQAGIRLVLTENDLNQALSSPTAAEFLSDLNIGSFGSSSGSSSEGYQVVNSRIQLDPDRIKIQAVLQGQDDQLAIDLESGFSVLSGRQLQFIDPSLTINGQAVPPELITGFAAGISEQFDLRNFEPSGITARILQLDIEPDQLQIAAFVKVEPEAIDR